MRIAVVVPFHTYAPAIRLTLGSLLRTHQKHELEIHVGVHSNYHHYTQDLSIFDELRKVAQVHMVDEIDWLSSEWNSCFYRYSYMHARNVANLFKCVRYYNFDRLFLVDHDVQFKEDFVTRCLERHSDADLVFDFFDGLDELREFTTSGEGRRMYAMPKISGWHLLMSRRLYEKAMEDPSCLFPRVEDGDGRRPYLAAYKAGKDLPVFFDMMTEMLHRARFAWGAKLGRVPAAEAAAWAKHFFASSFNYGRWASGGSYPAKMEEIRAVAEGEFPGGLAAELMRGRA